MKKNMFRITLTVGIIILFIITSAVPMISANPKETNNKSREKLNIDKEVKDIIPSLNSPRLRSSPLIRKTKNTMLTNNSFRFLYFL